MTEMEIDSGAPKPKRITAKDKDNNKNYQSFLSDIFGFKKTPATDQQRVRNTPTEIKEKILAWKHHPSTLAPGALSPKDIETRLWTIAKWETWHLGERAAAMRRINKAKKAAGVVVAAPTKSKRGKGKKIAQAKKENGFSFSDAPVEGLMVPGSREELLAIHDELIASLREFEDDTSRHMRRIKDITIALNRAAADIVV